MKYFILKAVFSCLLLLSTATLAFDSIDSKLQHAMEVRTSSPDITSAILNELSSEELNSTQRDTFEFLSGFQLLMESKNSEGVEKLEQLSLSSHNNDIKLRALGALLNTYAGLSEWNKAFITNDKIEDLLPQTLNPQIEQYAKISQLSLYNNIAEYETVKNKSTELLSKGISGVLKCSISDKNLFSRAKLSDSSLSDDDFHEASEYCASINEPVWQQVINADWAEFNIEKNNTKNAIIILNSNLPKLRELHYDSLTAYFLGLLTKAYIKEESWGEASKIANEVINNYSQDDYYYPHLLAYQALYQSHLNNSDFKNAFNAFREYKKLEKRQYDDKVAGKMAIEKARLEKDNKVSLLNQQNKLLSTQAELAAANDRNKNLLLLVATILLAIALFWIYKNRQTHKQLRKIAETDALTGIYNRNHFTQCAEASLAYCEKTQQNVSFIVFDLDYFKRVNDNYGHLVGDWALIQATKAVKQVCRANDIIGRMGGEEFAILLPNCAKDKAIEIAEVCRKQIAAIDTSETGHIFELTASFGVSHSSQVDYNLDKLFACADNALYQSKDAGRNRVYSFQQSQTVAETLPSSLVPNSSI